MILTMTSSFSSGVWSRGTMTSALVKFCSSFTWSKQQSPGHAFCCRRAKILCYWLRASAQHQAAQSHPVPPHWDGHHPKRATTRTRGWGQDVAVITEQLGFAPALGQAGVMGDAQLWGWGEPPCTPHLPSCHLCLSRGRRRRKAP